MFYDLLYHKHNFVIWTAARAAQRQFTTPYNIRYAIQETGLKAFAESGAHPGQDEFDDLHKQWCRSMIKAFKNIGVAASYGRVAKITGIYLKTVIVMASNENSPLLKVLHPPVDRNILKVLPVELKEFRKAVWTEMSESEYWQMVYAFRKRLVFDWRLEMLWIPEYAKD